MSAGRSAGNDSLLTAAEIARLANVTRAAVSNWRKRYPDFPEPARGAGRNALFALVDVNAWLERHGKADDVSPEALLWQGLRTAYEDDVLSGLADAAAFLVDGTAGRLDKQVCVLLQELAEETSAEAVVDGLLDRFIDAAAGPGAARFSSGKLVAAVQRFAGEVTGSVFDPACGVGSLLLAFGGRPGVALLGQDADPAAARLARMRARLRGVNDLTIRVGDSLRDDQWGDTHANLVVCEPPATVAGWGRDELMLDTRWEFGAPTKGEAELAWLQHCYAHVAPGGQALVVMPTSVGYRKAGRRIRAELVRRGALSHVAALPAGAAAGHAQPALLWRLVRPQSAGQVASSVQMVDLSTEDSDHVVDVPAIDLLDDEVDLTPQRYAATAHTDHAVAYRVACEVLAEKAHELHALLPVLDSARDALDLSSIKVSELSRAGLVAITDGIPLSTSDQLDSDYVEGFARAAALVRRSNGSSSGRRVDARGARIPQMELADQRRYGAAFRAVDEFERCLADLAKAGERATFLARDGLTRGTLSPGCSSAH